MSQLAERKRHVAEAMMRDAICDAAVSVLAEVGFGALTMDRVAEAAGVSKGTLYNYYADKDALVIAVINASFASMRTELDRLFAEHDYAPQALIEAIRAILEHVDQRDGLGRAVTAGGLTPAVDATIRLHRTEIAGQMTKVFVRAAAHGVLRPVGSNPEAIARLLVMTIDGTIRERLQHPATSPSREVELDNLRRSLIDFWFPEQAE